MDIEKRATFIEAKRTIPYAITQVKIAKLKNNGKSREGILIDSKFLARAANRYGKNATEEIKERAIKVDKIVNLNEKGSES